jgi:WD40 repeat protein
MSRDSLIIGINTYDYQQLGNLKAPAEDAEAIAQVLHQYGEFRVRRLPEAIDKETKAIRVGRKTRVTLTQLEEALIQLFKPSGDNIPETALFYFSGHGLRRDRGIQEGFLATSDVNPDSNHWGLRLKWLRELLQKSPVRQQIVWLDCCYSGELLNFDEADPGELGKGRDRCFIAASREYEVAYEETTSDHGVLTKALLQGLDPTQQIDGVVSNFTLVDFINQALRGATQRPIYANSGGQIFLTGKTIESTYSILAGICPYKGLAYFDCNDEDPKYFFGRTTLSDQLLEKIRQGNFLAVLGASGSGKSSVVRAGLLYQLKLGQRLSGSTQWAVKILRPGKYPLQSLARAFVDSHLSEIDQAKQAAKAEELLEAGAVGLGHIVQAFNAERVVLVVDQFEEVFTLCKDQTERQRFFECLLNTAENLGKKFTVVLTIRADFYGKCAEQDYAGLAHKIQANMVTVTPMNREELECAIAQPAKQMNLEVDQDLVTQIIADVEGSPGSLPLLQYTLTELWKQRVVNRLTLSAYTRLGGIKGTLQKRATEVYKSLSTEEQQIAKRIFLELTQLGEGTEDTRRQVYKKEFVNLSQSADLVDQVIQKLADEKLVVTSELIAKGTESKRIAVVDVAHETLIRHWSLLREWIEENRDALRKKRSIEEDAQEWVNKGKLLESGYLLQGLKLDAAEELIHKYTIAIPLSSSAMEFVQASQLERERQYLEELKREQRESSLIKEKLIEEKKARKAAQTRNRTLLISLIFVTGLGVFAVNQTIQTTLRNLDALSSSTENLSAANKPLEALTTAIEAGELLKKTSLFVSEDRKIRVLANFNQLIYGFQQRNSLKITNQNVSSVNFLSDNQRIVSIGDRTIDIRSTDGQLIQTLTAHQDTVFDAIINSKNDLLISGSRDNTIKIWKRASHDCFQLKNSISTGNEQLFNIAFSPIDQIIAADTGSGKIKLRDLSGRVIASLEGHQDRINHLNFSPNGQILASAGSENLVKLWSVKERNFIDTLSDDSSVTTVTFVDDQTVVSANSEGQITVWDWKNKQKRKVLPAHNESINRLAVSQDRKTIASASKDGTVKIWNIQNFKLLKTLKGHVGGVTNVSFSQRDKTLASAGEDGTVKVWTEISPKIIDGWTFSFSPNNQTIVTGDRDGNIKLWSRDGNLKKFISGNGSSVYEVRFSPDGKTIASISDDKIVKLWSALGEQLDEHKMEHLVTSLSFSHDSKTLATASEDEKAVNIWKLENGKLVQSNPLATEVPIKNVRFSPDSQVMAVVNANKIHLWNLANKKQIKSLSTESSISSISFSLDGIIGAAGYQGTVDVWYLNGKKSRSTFKGITDDIQNIAFSPYGQAIALAHKNQTTILLNLENQNNPYPFVLEQLSEVPQEDSNVQQVGFSPDGNIFASADNKNVILWNFNLDSLLKLAYGTYSDYLKYSHQNENSIRICR